MACVVPYTAAAVLLLVAGTGGSNYQLLQGKACHGDSFPFYQVFPVVRAHSVVRIHMNNTVWQCTHCTRGITLA